MAHWRGTGGVSKDQSRPASELYLQSLPPVSEPPHEGETNPMVHAEDRLHGHSGVLTAFVFSTHTSLYCS